MLMAAYMISVILSTFFMFKYTRIEQGYLKLIDLVMITISGCIPVGNIIVAIFCYSGATGLGDRKFFQVRGKSEKD